MPGHTVVFPTFTWCHKEKETPTKSTYPVRAEPPESKTVRKGVIPGCDGQPDPRRRVHTHRRHLPVFSPARWADWAPIQSTRGPVGATRTRDKNLEKTII